MSASLVGSEMCIRDSGYTPRDLDRRWSLALPLAKDLTGWGAPSDQTMSESARATFRAYRALRAKVTG
eukprot:36651-Alexandrium_andersonii.AAC.1